MNCQNCHLDAGTRPWGNNYGAVWSTYPKVRARSGKLETVSKRVNDCFERSLNGTALDTTGREMRAILAYMEWLSTGIPKGEKAKGSGIVELAFLERAADPERGALVYSGKCASSTGADGQGILDRWHRLSISALVGRAQLQPRCGPFPPEPFCRLREGQHAARCHMGYPQLSDEEAWDVAAYVNTMERPAKDLTGDWPDISKKPIDHFSVLMRIPFPNYNTNSAPSAPSPKPTKVNMSTIEHLPGCTCGAHDEPTNGMDRRQALRPLGALGAGLTLGPTLAMGALGDEQARKAMVASRTVQSGKAGKFTILFTSDIHSQLHTHDEFFLENGKPVYKKRGGYGVLKTMVDALRNEDPENTIVIDGGDCFQGGGVAAKSEGRAIVPLMDRVGYDLVLPGNWEVVYGKEMMLKDLGAYKADKICANMYHLPYPEGSGVVDVNAELKGELIPPYWTKRVAGVKSGSSATMIFSHPSANRPPTVLASNSPSPS